jgi:SNF2 family DNA or RNA helicase
VIERWPHQIEDTNALLAHPYYALWLDMGLGKSRVVIDAVSESFRLGHIDALIVVCPAFARSVWASNDPLLGELPKWSTVNYRISEYMAGKTRLFSTPNPGALDVVATNYELIRRPEHRNRLVQWAAARRTWLVLDESWAIKNPQSQQAKACYLLRQACERVTLLNGTPGAPEELFTAFQTMDQSILECKNYFHFRAKYCVMGEVAGYKKIVGYQRMDDFQARTAPYAVRRESKDCLTLPPVLPPVTIEARLSPTEWRTYCDMRDEMVAELESGDVAIARQAGVRTLRLAQILSGFVGGVEDAAGDEHDVLDAGDGGGVRPGAVGGAVRGAAPPAPVREIGRAKLEAVLRVLEALDNDKIVLWCKFKAEMERLGKAINIFHGDVHFLRGGQKPDERDAAKRAFAPGTASGPAYLVGHPLAGGAGINLAAANLAIYVSQGWSLKDRLQSIARIDRPGQTKPVTIVDVVAVGPKGQKTLDHQILSALRSKADVATWTAATWRRVLMDDGTDLAEED